MQNTVDAIANAQIVFQRLDVNVCGAFVDGLADDLVDELHHARLRVVAGDVVRLLAIFLIIVTRGLKQFLKRLGSNAIQRLNRPEQRPSRA